MTLPGTAEAPQISSSAVTDSSASRRRLSGGHLLTGVLVLLVVAALALAVLSLAKVRKLDGQLASQAKQLQAALQDNLMTDMQEELATLRRQLADNSRLIAGNRQSLTTALRQKPAQSETDAVTQQAQDLKALGEAQEGLKTRISTLEAQLTALSPVAASGSKASKQAVSATKKTKSASARRHQSLSPAIARASSVPFVLTGTERRGSSSLAAIAPKGYTSLSQIALIGEGESVAGWTLVHAGYGQATFRVHGRTVRVSTQ
ncbi:hypothetical protein [Klebsiella aerogenes]|uniref:Uncharacterized protein n=1 Tax=Klebsiella aerogenes TaxID=548 RepID=A0AAP9U7V7_KLEAE|nr:hypothetical protein [Klebsiella aerogenes]QMR42906.1 hypothetical protein HV331_25665 [Klebsiella aerogenes]